MGRPGVDFPVLPSIPKTGFSCRQVKSSGYYADLDTNCQVSASAMRKPRLFAHVFMRFIKKTAEQNLTEFGMWSTVKHFLDEFNSFTHTSLETKAEFSCVSQNLLVMQNNEFVTCHPSIIKVLSSFIHTNACTFSYNYVSVFEVI